jgi:hypothetical protein
MANYRVLVTGSQLWTDKTLVFEELDRLYYAFLDNYDYTDDDLFVVVHGACPNGADKFAHEWWEWRSYDNPRVQVERHPADWKGPRKRGAGYARNAEMVKLGADVCLAFILNESNGSTHCSGLAEKAGIETIYHRSTSVPTEERTGALALRPQPKALARRNVELRGVQITYRNFEGREELPFNRGGDRNFHIVLDDATANILEADGYNIKRRPPKEEGGDEFITLKVKVNFKGRPPTVALISKTKQTRNSLDESLVMLADHADFESIDLEISPYDWKLKTGETGRTAYLQTFYGILYESPLDLMYAQYVEEGTDPEAIEDVGMDDIEILDDTGWETEGEAKAIGA